MAAIKELLGDARGWWWHIKAYPYRPDAVPLFYVYHGICCSSPFAWQTPEWVIYRRFILSNKFAIPVARACERERERTSERERENNPGWSKWRGKTGELSCRENAREEKGWGIERSILTKNSFTDSLFARLGVDRANEKRNGVSS